MRTIDLMHLGCERVIACYEVDGVLIDPGPGSCLQTLLAALAGRSPRALLLTHVHLDHAGATGALVERWPDLRVHVHERGAPHLIDPSKLLGSAARLWGEAEVGRLWGEAVPVPEGNLEILHGGERLLDGAFEVAYTPGHAYHHVSYLRGGTLFAGDVAGVRLVAGAPVLPPTVPPEVDVEAWHESLHRVAGWAPERLAITHFGVIDADIEGHLRTVGRELDRWAAAARDGDEEAFVREVRAAVSQRVGEELLPAYVAASQPDLMYAGLERYWRKRAG